MMTAATGATTTTTSVTTPAGDAIVKPRRGTIASRYLAAIIGSTNDDGNSDVPVTAQAAAAAAAAAAAEAAAASSKSGRGGSRRKDNRTRNSYNSSNSSSSNLSNLAGLVSSGFDCSMTASTAALDQSESWTTQGTRYSTKTSNSTSAVAAAAAGAGAHVHTPTRGAGAGVGGWSSSKLGYSPHTAVNTTSTTVATTPTNSRPTTPVRLHTPGSASGSGSGSGGNRSSSWRSSSSSSNNNSSSNSPHHNHHLPPPGTSTTATSIMSVDSATTGEDLEDIDVLEEILGDGQKPQQQQALSIGIRDRMSCSTLQGWQSAVVAGGNEDSNSGRSSRSGSQSQSRPRSTTPTNSDRSSHSNRSSRSARSNYSSTGGGSSHSGRSFPRTTEAATRTPTQDQHLSNPYDLKKTPDSSITVRHSNRGHDRGMQYQQEHQHQHQEATGGPQHNDRDDDDSRFSNDEGDILVKSSDAGAATEVMTNRTSDVLTRVRDKLLSDNDVDVGRRGSHESSSQQRRPTQDELQGPPQLQRTHIPLPIIKEGLSSRASIPTTQSSTILMQNNNEKCLSGSASTTKKSSMKEKIVPSLIDACNSESMSMSTAPDNESYATDNGVIGAVNPQNLRPPRDTQNVRQRSVSSPSPPESTSFQILNTTSNSLATSTVTSVFDGIDLGPSFSSVQAEQGIPGSSKTNEYVNEQAITRPEKNTSTVTTTPSRRGSQQSTSRGRVAALGAHLRKAKWTVRGARAMKNEVEEPLLSPEEEGEGKTAYDNAAVVATYNADSSHHERIFGHFEDDESTLPEQRAGVDRSEDFVVYNKRVAENAKDVFQSKGFDNYDDSPTKSTQKKQAHRQDQFHGSTEGGKSPIQPLFSLDRLNLSHDAENSPIRKSHSTSKFPVEDPIDNISDSDQQLKEQQSASRPRSSSLSRSLEQKFSNEKSTSRLVREALARNRAPVVTPKPAEEDPDNDLDEELVHIMESSGQKTGKLSTTVESRPGSAPTSVRTSKFMVSPSLRVSPANHAAYSDHQRRYNEGPIGERHSFSASKQTSVRDKIRVFSSPSPGPPTTGEITAVTAPRVAMNTKPRMEEEKKDDEDSFFFSAGFDNDDGSVKSLREKIEQDLGINRMPSPVQHVGDDDDDFSVQSLRNRLEEKINKVNEIDDELDDDNSVRSLREKFEQPIVRPRGDNVSSLRAMFESKPKQSVIPPRPINSSHSRKTSSRPPVQQNTVMNEKDVVDTTAPPPTDDNVSPNEDLREHNMSGRRNLGAMEEATALLGAYRARERKRELEAAIQTKSGSALESEVDQSSSRQRATPEQNANSSMRAMRTRLDQWAKGKQRERGSEDSPSEMIAGTGLNHEVPRSKTSVIPAQPPEKNPDSDHHTNTDKNNIDIFRGGDQNESYGDDGQNIVPGSHWTTKGNGHVNAKMPQPISTKGSSSDSDYSDAVTLDASIADVSILTNPSAIRTKESKDVDDKDRHSDTSSSILSNTKKSETSSTQLSEAAAPLLAASMLPMSDETSRDHKRGDMSTLSEAAKSAVVKTNGDTEDNPGDRIPSHDGVETKRVPIKPLQAKNPENGDPWVAFPRETTPEPVEKEKFSSSMENWPDFEDEKEWTEDADGNYVAASSSYRENTDSADKTSQNFDVGNRFTPAGMTSTSIPNTHPMPPYVSSQYNSGPKQEDSSHSLRSPSNAFPVPRAPTPTNTSSGRKSADIHSATYQKPLQVRKSLAETQEAGPKAPFPSTHQRFSKTQPDRSGPSSIPPPKARVPDYEQPTEDYGPSREVMQYTGASNFSATSPAPVPAAPAVPPVPSPLDPDYETLMSSRHKMLLSRQRALQHRRASRARANLTPSPAPTQGGFFGRTHPDRSHTPDPPSITPVQNPPSPRSMHSTRSLPNYQSPAVSPGRSVRSTPRTPPRSMSPHSRNSTPTKLSGVRTPPRPSNEAKIRQRSAVTGFDPFGFPVYNNIDDSEQKAFEALTRPSNRGSRDPEGVRVADMPVNNEFTSRRTSYGDAQQGQRPTDDQSLYSKVKSRFSLPSPLSTTFRRQQKDLSQSEAVVARISAVRAARLRRLHAYGERQTSTPSGNSLPMPRVNHHNPTQRRSPSTAPAYRYYTHDDDKEDDETISMQATGPGEEDMSLSTNNSNSPQDFAAHLEVD